SWLGPPTRTSRMQLFARPCVVAPASVRWAAQAARLAPRKTRRDKVLAIGILPDSFYHDKSLGTYPRTSRDRQGAENRQASSLPDGRGSLLTRPIRRRSPNRRGRR